MIEILNTFLSVVLTGVITYVVWYLQTSTVAKRTDQQALKILLKQELRKLYLQYTVNDTITIDEYEDFAEIYKIYHELGGNGTGTHMMEEINKIRTRGDHNEN